MFHRPLAHRSTITAFKTLAVQKCVFSSQGFSSSICQAVVGVTQACMTIVMRNVGRASWFAIEGAPHNAPKLADFLVHLFRVGLAWHTIGIYHSSFLTFGTSTIIKSLQITISSLNECIILITATPGYLMLFALLLQNVVLI